MPRDSRYLDPLELIWTRTALQLGMVVARSDEVYASWDGARTLTLSSPEGFDPDDCLAQMIFHEICHALVEGPASLRKIDWGLINTDDRDVVREQACHRVQAALADRHGLREFMGPTTDFRPYYDALPAHPLLPGPDPAIEPAREAWLRGTRGPWAPHIEAALAATAAIARAARPFAPPDSLFARTREPHPLGFPPGDPAKRCGDCAWRQDEPGPRCRQAGAALDPDWPACSRFEDPGLDCRSCGACCREAFHQVPVEEESPLWTEHPDWIARDEYGPHLPRPQGRCVALRGPPFLCAAYAARPASCRDFEIAGENCLIARRRVGLSP